MAAGHGGARPGAGRPRQFDDPIKVQLRPQTTQRLGVYAGARGISTSEAIRRIVESRLDPPGPADGWITVPQPPLPVDPQEWIPTTGVDLLLAHGAAVIRDDQGDEIVGWLVDPDEDELTCTAGHVAVGHVWPGQDEVTAVSTGWSRVAEQGRDAAAARMLHTLSYLTDQLAAVAVNAIRSMTRLAAAGVPFTPAEHDRDGRDPQNTLAAATGALARPLAELDAALYAARQQQGPAPRA